MRIRCSAEDLHRAVQVASRATSTRSPMPILQNLLLEATEDHLRLSGTDLEIGIRTAVPCLVEEAGRIGLPSRILGEITAHLPPDTVEIRTGEAAVAEIRAGRAQFEIHGTRAEDFPKMPEEEGGLICVIPSEALRTMIRSTIFACSTDETRPFLTGVYLQVAPGEVRAVATDGGRLALRRFRTEGETREWAGIVPAKAMNELARLLGSVEEDVALSSGGGQLVVRCGDVVLWSRLISGSFPNYEQVIPTASNLRLDVGTEALRAALRRVSITARDSASVVRFAVEPGILRLESNTPEVGRASEELDAQTEGSGLVVAFNARYLLDALAVITSDRVRFELVGPLSPGALRPVGNEEYVYVLAPVRVYG